MTDDVKKDIYDAVKLALEETELFKLVAHYNSQDEDNAFRKEKAHGFPRAYIYFSNISWLPTKNQIANPYGTQEQNAADMSVAVRVVSYSLKDDNESIDTAFDLINEVYRTLNMLESDNFTPLQRESESDDVDNNNVRTWEITFKTMGQETGITSNVVDAAPVTLQINK